MALGWKQCVADNDLWMKDCKMHYEYICIWVDDLAMAMKNPQAFVDELKSRFGYKLKGVGAISYHLGANFYRDPDGMLCMSSTEEL